MLSFLWKKRRASRLLFEYWDGTKNRREDPLAIQQGLESHPTWRFDVHTKEAEAGNLQSYELTLNALCDVFKVQRFNADTGLGLTQSELIGLLNQFSEYIEQKKNNIWSLPIRSDSTAGTSQHSNGQTTNATSASSSTPIDQKSGLPTQ